MMRLSYLVLSLCLLVTTAGAQTVDPYPASGLSGQVSVPNGGTGLATQTSNIIYKGNGTSAEAVSSITDNGTNILFGEAPNCTASALSVATTVLVNGALSCTFTFTLANSSDTMGAPSNALVGQKIEFQVTQAAAGGPYTLAWNAAYTWGIGSAPVINPTASSVTIVDCVVTAATPTLQCFAAAVNSAAVQGSTVAAPVAPASTVAFAAQGLSSGATVITPKTTGNIHFTINGTVVTGTGTATAAGTGIQYRIIYGSGNGNANASATLGTTCGPTQSYKNVNTVIAADIATPFSLSCIVTGLTIGTGYYADLAAESISVASGIGLANVAITPFEIR